MVDWMGNIGYEELLEAERRFIQELISETGGKPYGSFVVTEGEEMREFETGATRDNDATKLDFEGFLSPLVLERYAEYMNEHRKQADGNLRASDNWQKGMPKESYMKSLLRHVFDVWFLHRGYDADNDAGPVSMEEALCSVMFNAMGYLFEELRVIPGIPARDN